MHIENAAGGFKAEGLVGSPSSAPLFIYIQGLHSVLSFGFRANSLDAGWQGLIQHSPWHSHFPGISDTTKFHSWAGEETFELWLTCVKGVCHEPSPCCLCLGRGLLGKEKSFCYSYFIFMCALIAQKLLDFQSRQSWVSCISWDWPVKWISLIWQLKCPEKHQKPQH